MFTQARQVVRRLSSYALGNDEQDQNGHKSSGHLPIHDKDSDSEYETLNAQKLLAEMLEAPGDVTRQPVQASDSQVRNDKDFPDDKKNEFLTELNKQLIMLKIDLGKEVAFLSLHEYLFERCGASDAIHESCNNVDLAKAVLHAALSFLYLNEELEVVILSQIVKTFHFSSYNDDLRNALVGFQANYEDSDTDDDIEGVRQGVNSNQVSAALICANSGKFSLRRKISSQVKQALIDASVPPILSPIYENTNNGQQNDAHFPTETGHSAVVESTEEVTAAELAEQEPWDLEEHSSVDVFGEKLNMPAPAAPIRRAAAVSVAETVDFYDSATALVEQQWHTPPRAQSPSALSPASPQSSDFDVRDIRDTAESSAGLEEFNPSRAQRNIFSELNAVENVNSGRLLSPMRRMDRETEQMNFGFSEAIVHYYNHQYQNKRQALNELIGRVLELCDLDSALGLNVRAPIAINALVELQGRVTLMDEIYPHLYTILQAVLATENQNAVQKEHAAAAQAVIAKAKQALQWLFNAPQSILSELQNVHARMIENWCGELSAEEKLAQFHTTKSAHITNVSPKKMSEMLRESSFVWSSDYIRGADEEKNDILERRRHFEVIAASALKIIVRKCKGGESLSLEQQWLLVTAITDYDDARGHLKRFPKKRTLAVSPFYNAIQLLAKEQRIADETVSELLRADFIKNYKEVKASSLEQQSLQERLAARADLIFEKVLKEVPLESPSPSSQASSSSTIGLATPVRCSTHADCSEMPSAASNHSDAASESKIKSIEAVHQAWQDLDRKYSGMNDIDREGIISIFRLFDAKCHATPKAERNALQPLLEKAFVSMQGLFNLELGKHNRYHYFSTYQGAPVEFESFMKCIAPKAHLPAYIFLQFCAYQATKLELFRYEENFIKKHINRLYFFEGNEPEATALDTIKNKEQEPLRQSLAPISRQGINLSPGELNKTAIGLIYKNLNIELKKLEAKNLIGILTKEDIEPYKHLKCVGVSEVDQHNRTVGRRINILIKAVNENAMSFTTPNNNGRK